GRAYAAPLASDSPHVHPVHQCLTERVEGLPDGRFDAVGLGEGGAEVDADIARFTFAAAHQYVGPVVVVDVLGGEADAAAAVYVAGDEEVGEGVDLGEGDSLGGDREAGEDEDAGPAAGPAAEG